MQDSLNEVTGGVDTHSRVHVAAGVGNVEAIRALRVVRRSAVKACTQASNQIRDLIVTAPDELRERLVELSTTARIELCARNASRSRDRTW